ncbi:MAG TPA: outer membrane lipoprotein carrier protein LolA [Chitinophagales bacterium]|nr:outer membrane lipoprotein carrier protein LolA [Chitinophagales bacterium]
MKYAFLVILLLNICPMFSQNDAKTYVEDEADLALKKMSRRYEALSIIYAEFELVVNNPKTKPTDDEAKLTTKQQGTITLKGDKFSLKLPKQEIICNGKNIWTLNFADKETQLSLFEESDDVFSPAKLFSFYKTGYSYQVKERKPVNGKKAIVIEMSPVNKKTSYFKIDVTIDIATSTLLQTKIYAKNGVRYTYNIIAEKDNLTLPDTAFEYNTQKYPQLKLIDLR